MGKKKNWLPCVSLFTLSSPNCVFEKAKTENLGD